MPGLIPVHQVRFHRIGLAVQLVLARLVKMQFVQLLGTAGYLKGPAGLIVDLNRVTCVGDVDGRSLIVNQQSVVDFGLMGD